MPMPVFTWRKTRFLRNTLIFICVTETAGVVTEELIAGLWM